MSKSVCSLLVLSNGPCSGVLLPSVPIAYELKVLPLSADAFLCSQGCVRQLLIGGLAIAALSSAQSTHSTNSANVASNEGRIVEQHGLSDNSTLHFCCTTWTASSVRLKSFQDNLRVRFLVGALFTSERLVFDGCLKRRPLIDRSEATHGPTTAPLDCPIRIKRDSRVGLVSRYIVIPRVLESITRFLAIP